MKIISYHLLIKIVALFSIYVSNTNIWNDDDAAGDANGFCSLYSCFKNLVITNTETTNTQLSVAILQRKF